MAHKCSANVASGSFRVQSCSRPGTVEEGGKWWCKQHAPSIQAARRASTSRRYELEAAIRIASTRVATQRDRVVNAVRRATAQCGAWDEVEAAMHELRLMEQSVEEARKALAGHNA